MSIFFRIYFVCVCVFLIVLCCELNEICCVQIECESDELCEPVYREEKQFGEHVRMVLVRPVAAGGRWGDIFDLPPNTDFQG